MQSSLDSLEIFAQTEVNAEKLFLTDNKKLTLKSLSREENWSLQNISESNFRSF